MDDKFIEHCKRKQINLDDLDVRKDYEAMYALLDIAGNKGVLQSAIYMLYYSFIKEVDSINRAENLSQCLQIPCEYRSQLCDKLLYEYKPKNNLQTIDIDEFKEIARSEEFVLKIGAFRNISPMYSFSGQKIIECSLDGSPVFKIIKNDRMQLVKLDITPALVPLSGDIESLTDKLLQRFVKGQHVNNIFEDELGRIIHFYLTKGFALATKINSWLNALLTSPMLGYCITDQTLLPAVSFISHEVRRHRIPLLVLQHQRNLLLSNLYPLLLPGFKLASTYYSWFSQQEINKVYPEKLRPDNFVHVSDIPFCMVTKTHIEENVRKGKKCLLIINEAFDAYINGVSIYTKIHAYEVENMCKLLHSLGVQVFIRDYPNSNRTLAIPDTCLDDSDKLEDTFGKYDFYLTDRVGNSVMDILEYQGFLFVFPQHYQSYLSEYYKHFKVNEVFADGENAMINQLLPVFDLLAVWENSKE